MVRSLRCLGLPAAAPRTWITALLASAGALLAEGSARGEEGRFDAQVFRPSAAPRDLVMVRKSEIIGHLSPTVGVFSDLAFDPLVLVNKSTDQAVNAVLGRLTVTPMAGIGLWDDWADLTVAVPLIAWQTGGNLRSIGTEGPVRSFTPGDVRLSTRVALPYFNRREEDQKGFGMAIAGDLNLPTGSPKDFTGDGAVTGGPTLIADYRFSVGVIVTANAGLWFRPDRQLAGVRVGDMASFGLGAEAYVIKRWGLSVLGEVYGYPSLTRFPSTPAQVPAEFLLGGRWQGAHGISVTLGGSFGAACSFGAPAFRLWSSITFQWEKSREQVHIDRIKAGGDADPDRDGVIDDEDACRDVAGPRANHGCPDTDLDGDGVVDREDACPMLPAGPGGNTGCPAVYIKEDRIELAEEVRFAPDSDVILEVSRPILDHVADVLLEHPEIREVEIEDHTDSGAADAHGVVLSQRRVDSIVRYLVDKRGIEPERLKAKGLGHLEPIADDTKCAGPEETLSAECRASRAANRGVIIRIVRRGAPPSHAITGGGASALPWGVLPRPRWVYRRVLPFKPREDKRTLPGSVNPWITPGEVGGVLPFYHVLPRTGTPRSVLEGLKKAAPEKAAPEKAAPEKAAPEDAPQ